ncbi:amino acid transporter [Xylaria castorea]|nr:amino acid transporter [Xylaria castorea]
MVVTSKDEKQDDFQDQPELAGVDIETIAAADGGVAVNAAGYKDQLKRQYGFWGIVGIALTVDNAWAALGSSISVSILNGGPPGLIYGLLVALFWYSFIGLGLAELASSVPTAGGVYHWATIAGGPRWGRMLGFFTGWINFYGWMFDLASLVQITANILVQLYATYHQGTYVSQPWHVYLAYVAVLWLSTLFIIFANRLVPYTQTLGLFFVMIGGVITIIVIAAMPKTHASSHFVWASFGENNLTGWQGGVAFLLGVLNGAFTIGTPDAITHIAEELPNPRRDLPKAMGLQIGLGFLYAFVFAIALSYAITDISQLQGGINTYPLAGIYQQATQSAPATFGLLFILLLTSLCCCVGTVLTNSRTYWALARDNAVPFSPFFGRVNESLSCPIESTIFVCVFATGLGAIPLGSSSAFLALTGSFIVLTTISYAIPFTANVLTGRKYFPAGPFHLGKLGNAINLIAVLLIVLFDIFFFFPYSLPTTVESMNYNSVILVGTIAISVVWWFVHATRHYPGPKVMRLYIHDDGTPSNETEILEKPHTAEDSPQEEAPLTVEPDLKSHELQPTSHA